jgi:DNA helicase-2/ATP-dependent DNA helicase PcrA
VAHPVVDEELALLARVSRHLNERAPTRTAREEPIVKELERLRAVMLSGDESKDLSALTEQYHNQSAILNQLRRAGSGPTVDPRSPYFAHLRLAEDGRERDLCLGHATCIEKGVRIVDWRDAPISKIFYSYRQGDEYDEEIAGRERIGEVVVRRMVRIRDARLDRVQAPEGDFVADPLDASGWRLERAHAPRLAGGEGAAFHFHEDADGGGRRFGSDPGGEVVRADKRLPEITGLIDPEQFELITRPRAGFVVIRGAAGSGKTTVALHRVAFLAFDDPALDGPDTLAVMFSRALQRFVGRVLPSLGLDRVRVESYREWAAAERRRHLPGLPTRRREDTSSIVQRIKLHPFLASALERHVAARPGLATWHQVVDDWASLMVDGEALVEAAEKQAPGLFSEQEIKRFVLDQHGHVERVLAVAAGEVDPDAELDPEDDALLLRAWQLRIGPLCGAGRRPHSLRHLVIDEVQDFSPIEVQVLLGCLAPGASITLAGDTQQSVIAHSGFDTWAGFFAHLSLVAPRDGVRPWRVGTPRRRAAAAGDDPRRPARGALPLQRSRGVCGVPGRCLARPRGPRTHGLGGRARTRRCERRALLQGARTLRAAATAARDGRGLLLRSRHRGDRRRAGQGPRVRLCHRGRLRRSQLSGARRGPPQAARRSHPRDPSALAHLRGHTVAAGFGRDRRRAVNPRSIRAGRPATGFATCRAAPWRSST